jgi:hypothetical protein
VASLRADAARARLSTSAVFTVRLETHVSRGIEFAIGSERARASVARRPRARFVVPAFAVALGALALGGCDEPSPTRAPAPPRSTPEVVETPFGYRVVEVEEPGSIAGTVRWVGPVPPTDAVPVRVHRERCGETQPSQALRVSARGGIADTVLWLSDVRAGLAAEPPSQPPALSIQSCRFVPHVMAVGAGWTLAFRNDDAMLQNVHVQHEGQTLWDFALPEAGSTETRAVQVLGPLHVVSDVHAWMHAWVHAFPHPYFAVTGADGRFRIHGVPPGQYVVRVWHEGWRIVGTRSGRPQYSTPVILTRTISVSSQQETTIDFELSQESGEIAGEE